MQTDIVNTSDFLWMKILWRADLGDLLTIFSILIALITLLYVARSHKASIDQFRMTLERSNNAIKSAHYSELDRFYADLLALVIENPFLRNPAPLTSDEQALSGGYQPFSIKEIDKTLQYEAYVYMVWNFIETIHDRCYELYDSSGNDNQNFIDLKRTWKPVIDAENEIHRGWFLAEIHKRDLPCNPPLESGDETVAAEESSSDCLGNHKFCYGFRKFVQKSQWNEFDWTYEEEPQGSSYL